MARVDAVLPLFKEVSFDGLMVTLDAGGHALALIDTIRLGATACDSTLPIAVMAANCDSALAERLRALDVRRVILKPFKAKTALETIAGLWQQADGRASPTGAVAAGIRLAPASCQ